jgi:Cys-tRNA(Pro)/Cys-tRNA(Cys) deacylase
VDRREPAPEVSRRPGAGAATPAIAAAQRAGVEHRIHRYDAAGGPGAADGYGAEAAAALGVEPTRVHKTLVVEADGGLVVAVVPVSARLDLRALAAAVGARRATMAEPVAASRATGYVLGGISPLGQRRALPTVVDAAALALPTVYVSAGRRGLEIELAPQELVRLTGAVTARISG